MKQELESPNYDNISLLPDLTSDSHTQPRSTRNPSMGEEELELEASLPHIHLLQKKVNANIIFTSGKPNDTRKISRS